VHNPSDQTPTVRVAEDDVIVSIVIADDLRLAGFDVIEAGSGAEALALLSTDRYIDLIQSDVHMPGRRNGTDLAAIIMDRFPQTRIILCSGGTDGHDLTGSSGIPFIDKPCRPEAVIALVALQLQDGTLDGTHDRSTPRAGAWVTAGLWRRQPCARQPAGRDR
jgi:CheY-like chemotaxis protein